EGRPVSVIARACPLLVPLAEEGWLDDEIAEAVARRYLTGLRDEAPAIDVLVLGCTHYPLLRGVLGRVARELFQRDVKLVHSAEAMAHAAHRELTLRGLERVHGATRLRCFVTDDARIAEVGQRFLGRPLDGIERVDL